MTADFMSCKLFTSGLHSCQHQVSTTASIPGCPVVYYIFPTIEKIMPIPSSERKMPPCMPERTRKTTHRFRCLRQGQKRRERKKDNSLAQSKTQKPRQQALQNILRVAPFRNKLNCSFLPLFYGITTDMDQGKGELERGSRDAYTWTVVTLRAAVIVRKTPSRRVELLAAEDGGEAVIVAWSIP
ncbi:hypothetical protein CONLIGDRAFT_435024 [Coniochaeta ligniaria NRRL 30616]|uniref:Uncharacterized protein n=1 Tax=Coniochaeta ligniaria NRRL 30616 TaxID=1408157 RepID=A0A1J7IJP2_9PEZI|nr:hypothetical protein CONLIGDRAFT_435024 [Coniochaeta ligniaria NRRL 30616]